MKEKEKRTFTILSKTHEKEKSARWGIDAQHVKLQRLVTDQFFFLFFTLKSSVWWARDSNQHRRMQTGPAHFSSSHPNVLEFFWGDSVDTIVAKRAMAPDPTAKQCRQQPMRTTGRDSGATTGNGGSVKRTMASSESRGGTKTRWTTQEGNETDGRSGNHRDPSSLTTHPQSFSWAAATLKKK